MDRDRLTSEIREINEIVKEQKRLNKMKRDLEKRKQNLMKNVKEYLHNKKLDAGTIKVDEFQIKVTDKKQRQRHTSNARRDNIVQLLNLRGVDNSREVAERILEVFKGDEVIMQNMEIHRQNKKLFNLK